jgi:hypothetical protein
MHVMFERFLAPGSMGQRLISEETERDTQATVMTAEQAVALGFSGLPEDPQGRERRFIVCTQGDARRIQSQLEMHNEVAAFRMHEINLR